MERVSLEGSASEVRLNGLSLQQKERMHSGVGAILKGTVKNIRPFGAFISTSSYTRECLLHISNISVQRVENVEDALQIGQEVWVKVVKEEADGRVAVSMKEVNQETGEELFSAFASLRSARATGGGVQTPELNSIHQATVKRIQPFGAFLALDGFDRDGLLHISAISKSKIDKVEDVLSVGDRVWVKVCKVDEDGKYGLDMRDISQRDGTDNDPNNVHRGKTQRPPAFKQEAIVLEAVVNATCTRCGGKGHMSHECYNSAGKKYEMVEDEEGSAVAFFSASSRNERNAVSASATGANCIPVRQPTAAAAATHLPSFSSSKDKEGSREKENIKKKRKRGRSYSDSSSDDSDDSRKRKKKKKKSSDHHKHKKKHKK